jgi:hypothetical protein
LPAGRREHQPKSKGAPATERGRAAPAAMRIQACYAIVFRSFYNYPSPWTATGIESSLLHFPFLPRHFVILLFLVFLVFLSFLFFD